MILWRLLRMAVGGVSMALGLIWGFRAEADPAMWVVKDADSTVYLLGTIHVMKPGIDWRSDKLAAALKASDQYWMEADVGADPAIAQTYALNFGMDARHPLPETLGEKDFAKLMTVAERFQIPADHLHEMRPWLATMVVSRAQILSIGYDPELGVDRTLEKEAMAAGKTVKAFETADQQLGFMAHLPDKIAKEMLIQTMDELDEGEKAVDELSAAWLAGDVKRLQKVGPDKMRKEAPELYDAIVLQRNANWMKQIDSMLKSSGTQFIAVGAAHLLGKDGLPEQLKKLGYKVERY